MPFRVPRARRAAVAAITTILVGSAAAEIIGPGTFRAAYHVDRWGQRRFGFLFIDEPLHQRLAPLLGRTIALDVQELDHGDGDERRLATKIGAIDVLPQDLRFTVAWKTDDVASIEALRVAEDARVRVEATIANVTDHAVALNLDWANALDVEIAARTIIGPPEFWYGAFCEGFSRLQRGASWSVGRKRIAVGLDDVAFDGATKPSDPQGDRPKRPEATHSKRPKTMRTLAAGASLRFIVTLDHVPANEYELALIRSERMENDGHPTTTESRSNTLRLDVIESESKPSGGLRIDFDRAPADVKPKDGGVALRATFVNTTAKTLCFEVPRGRDLSDWTVGYDGSGALVHGTLWQDFVGKAEAIRLAPGASTTFDVEVPRETKLARIAWWCGRSDADETRGETALPLGYHVSRHVRL